MIMKRPAVFMDRDGTISEEVGYLNHSSRLRVFPYSGSAIKLLNDGGWLAVVITNQAGVARGYFTEQMIHEVHDRLSQEIAVDGARLDAIYYCAHHPTVGDPPYRIDCDCRKPKPGLITRAAADLEIDLDSSWMIGDRYNDVLMARNAGVKSVLVMTGYGRGEWEYQRRTWDHQPDLISENLLAAVEQITGVFAGHSTGPGRQSS
jgi:D-glycero-D-manno-heptose 1,7-bisphosphate phosphatase